MVSGSRAKGLEIRNQGFRNNVDDSRRQGLAVKGNKTISNHA